MKTTLLVLGCVVLCVRAQFLTTWAYEAYISLPDVKAPAFWYESFPDCDGDKQTPINIKTADVAEDNALVALKFNYPADSELEVINKGYTIEVEIEAEDQEAEHFTMTDTNGVLYKMAQLHFHWHDDPTANLGSEHKVNGNSYPMEGHFVHYNAKFDNISEALASGEQKAVSVVGVFYTTTSGSADIDMSALAEVVDSEYIPGAKTPAEISLEEWLPENRAYYTYDGSLTTPPCTEVVQWFVMSEPVSIPLAQLTSIRSMINTQLVGVGVDNNIRPTQSYEPHVRQYVPGTSSPAASNAVCGSVVGLLAALALL
eukprot:TRINITY_DN18343_c0_g1_i1.p1 TRINITY_DN18343_c0_g1~~TRINITY_DN18343_c0_g1_i1.p1  ORF type:complete len:314 (-),score=81.78 TRINITY_DN18343_c0_g1_i1:61-1002(-)